MRIRRRRRRPVKLTYKNSFAYRGTVWINYKKRDKRIQHSFGLCDLLCSAGLIHNCSGDSETHFRNPVILPLEFYPKYFPAHWSHKLIPQKLQKLFLNYMSVYATKLFQNTPSYVFKSSQFTLIDQHKSKRSSLFNVKKRNTAEKVLKSTARLTYSEFWAYKKCTRNNCMKIEYCHGPQINPEMTSWP